MWMAAEWWLETDLDKMKTKRIGIIGTGNVGGALGLGLARAGYPVIFGERKPGQTTKLLERLRARVPFRSVNLRAKAIF